MSRNEAQQFMPSRRSFMRGAAGVAAVGVTAAACGGNTGRSGGPSLSQWYHQYGEAGTQQAAEKYAKAYDKADVTINWKPGDYATLLSAALLTSKAPDVFESGLNTQMVKAKQIVPLDDIIDPVRDDFAEQDLATNTVDGKTYGVKMIDDPQFFYYRKSMFDDAGVKPPKTLDELVDICKKLSSKDVKALYAGKDAGVGALSGPALWSTGGDYLDKDGKIGFDSKRTTDAYELLRKLSTDKTILPDYTTEWTDPGAFMQNQCAMQWCGLWAMPAIQKTLGEDFGVFPFPMLDDKGRNAVVAGGWTEFVCAKSDNVEAAKKFVKWLWIDKSDYQEDWSLSFGFHIPPRKSLAAKAKKLQSGPAAEAVKLYNDFGVPGNPSWTPAMGTPFSDMATNIIRKGANSESELAKAVDKVNTAIKQAG